MKKIIMGASLLAASLSAQAVETAVGLSVSTFGAGVEVTFGINEHLSIRGHFSEFSYDYDDFEDEFDDFETVTNAKAKGKLGAVGVIFDYHPLGGKLRLSTGLLHSGNESSGRFSVEDEPVGDNTTVAQCQSAAPPADCYTGDFSLKVDLGGTVPYFGIGFGSAASEGSPLGFGVDLGVVPMSVGVDYKLLDDTSGVSQAAIEQDIAKLEKEAEKYKWYPFINLTASYRF